MPAHLENSAVATGLEKVVFIPIPKIGNVNECSNYGTIALISHASTEKAMAPHSTTFAWKIPWMEEPARLQSMGSLESDTTERLHFYFSLLCIREGNGNPLRCSCLENPRDGGAWWAAIYGVTQGQTRPKRLSSSSSSMHTHTVIFIFFLSLKYPVLSDHLSC